MYRVELKVFLRDILDEEMSKGVPNAPRGVERTPWAGEQDGLQRCLFLMHRVELKVSKDVRKSFHFRPF